MEGDVVAVGEDESGGRGGEFKRGDGRVKLEAEDWFVDSQVPPSVVESVCEGSIRFATATYDSLNRTILPTTHDGVPVAKPYNTLDSLLMGMIFALGCKETWVSVGTVEIEDANFLLLIASYNLGGGGGGVDGANDVVMWEGMERFTGVRVPDFAAEFSL